MAIGRVGGGGPQTPVTQTQDTEQTKETQQAQQTASTAPTATPSDSMAASARLKAVMQAPLTPVSVPDKSADSAVAEYQSFAALAATVGGKPAGVPSAAHLELTNTSMSSAFVSSSALPSGFVSDVIKDMLAPGLAPQERQVAESRFDAVAKSLTSVGQAVADARLAALPSPSREATQTLASLAGGKIAEVLTGAMKGETLSLPAETLAELRSAFAEHSAALTPEPGAAGCAQLIVSAGAKGAMPALEAALASVKNGADASPQILAYQASFSAAAAAVANAMKGAA